MRRVDALTSVTFPHPALRTGRACLHASGSPRAHAFGLCDRPLVQLGLDPQYPRLGPLGVRPQHVGIHQRSPTLPLHRLRTRCRPSPCARLSRPRTTTAAPPRPGPLSRRRTDPLPTWTVDQRDQPGTLPTFTTH